MSIQPFPGRLESARIQSSYADGYWKDEVVVELLAARAQSSPDELAVVCAERRCSWSELHRLCQRLALHLRELGIAPGDVVALQMPNWLEYLVCYYGIQMAGALVVQPGVDWRARELLYALGIGPAKAIIMPKTFLGHDYCNMLTGIREQLPQLEHVLVARGDAPAGHISLDDLLAEPIEKRIDPASLDAVRPSAEQVVRVVFTSGTTGLPKAIMHTNNTTAHSSRTLVDSFAIDHNDVIFMYVPLSTNYGLIMGLHLHVTSGAKLVLLDKFSATKSLSLIEQEQITYVPGTPTAFIALANSPALKQFSQDSIRMMISAGASFPVPAIKHLRQAIPGTFIESFGMNEFGMGFWCSPHDPADEIDGAIGKPIAGLEAKVVDEQGKDLALGLTGELLIKSAGMCAGYHNRAQANEDAWDASGWFYSGDLASIDEQGNFRIVGRSKDVIIRGGANVSPREIEELLSTDSRVLQVSVIGLPDDYYGEVVCACIIGKDDHLLTLEDVRALLHDYLAAYKLPSRLFMADEFPLNAMGKVRKDVLIEQVLNSPI